MKCKHSREALSQNNSLLRGVRRDGPSFPHPIPAAEAPCGYSSQSVCPEMVSRAGATTSGSAFPGAKSYLGAVSSRANDLFVLFAGRDAVLLTGRVFKVSALPPTQEGKNFCRLIHPKPNDDRKVSGPNNFNQILGSYY